MKRIIYIVVIVALFATPLVAKQKTKLKVISLSPCLTELIFYLGEGDKLVGRSSACDYPKEAKKIESVGDFGKPSLEKLLTLKPDVIVGSALADPAIKSAIEQFGIKFHLLPGKSFQDYYKTVKTLGEILNCQDKAQKEITRVKEALANFAVMNKKMKDQESRRHQRENRRSTTLRMGKSQKQACLPIKPTSGIKSVYMEIWDRPYMTIGSKSFITDLIKYAGGENIAKLQNDDYFNCSVEWIITSNPSIIIAPAMKTGREADIKNRKGWQNIDAVKNNRIYIDLNDDLIYRLGPRIIDGIKLLRGIILK